MCRSLLAGIAFLLATVSASVTAAPFSNVYFFGDSLSDTGNDFILSSTLHASDPAFPIVPAPAGYNDSGRFSNGPVYSEQLAGRLGFDLRPSLLGGTNYAYGGARSGSVIVPGSLSFAQQVEQYVGAAAAGEPGALYVLFIGSNDVEDILAGAPPGQTIASAVGRIGTAIETLAADGAAHFLIPNVPDLGLVPGTTGDGAVPRAPLASAASAAFNDALAALLDSFATLDITAFDTFALMNDAVANPPRYGLTDVQHRCQRESGIGPDGQVQYEVLCSDEEAATRLFWDGFHPTTAGHRALADALFAALEVPEPATLALLLGGILILAGTSRRATPARRAA
ncbi:SGNH/GDSL hydrolase family protein [Aromatoleum sp.]|uniref:SGNH/GDSL hydrolase family protein n=1 Tax=Aromatoleum sp. TaxID=2307007 RepID=UPI002FCC8FA3